MKNKNILVGLGFGLLANINNKTKNRSSDIISNDSEYVERVVKLFNTSEEFDFQLRIKALKKWKGGEIIKLFGDERPEQILTEAVTNFDFEVIEKKNGNIITGILGANSTWNINFSGTWESASDDEILIEKAFLFDFENQEKNIYIYFRPNFLLEKVIYEVELFLLDKKYLFFMTLMNKKLLIEYLNEFDKDKSPPFPNYFYILFVKEIPELFFKTLRENDKLLDYFVESLYKNIELFIKFKEIYKLPEDLFKIIEERLELKFFKEILDEIRSFFEIKSKLLNDMDSLLEKKPEVLIKHNLWITEKPELQNTLKKLIEENYKLSEDVLKLKNKIKETIFNLENIYDFFGKYQPKLLSLAKDLQEDNTKFERFFFIDSIELYPLLSKNFEETFDLSESILKLNEEKEKLIKIQDFLDETESFFKTKSKVLNYFTPSVIENPEFLIEYKLFITENPELQEKLEEFLKEKPKLLNKLKSLLASK